jgi:hypothetical protein
MPFKTNFKSKTLKDGKVVVFDVPIFAVCEKQGIKFTEDWIDQAVSYHQKGEANGSAWAMHIHHTDEEGRPVLPAGAFTNTRKGMVRTKDGELVAGVICDLVFSDEKAKRRAKLGQLLWRSPEIPMTAAIGEKPARFKSLALLDRDAPHNDDLPILTFKKGSVPFRKKAGHLVHRASQGREPVLAFAETGDSIFALMEPTTMATNLKKTTLKLMDDDEAPFGGESDSGGDEGGDEGGKSESKGSGWKAKLDALKACKIEAEEIPDFVAALQECAAEIGGEAAPADEIPAEEPVVEDDPELDENVDGPADPLEGEEGDPLEDLPMKDESDAVVRLRDELVQLKADRIAEKKLAQQDRMEREVVAATDEAFERLKFKGFSREEVIAFGADEPLSRRAKAIKKLADISDAKLLARDADFEAHVEFAANGNSQSVPDEIIKFQAEGPGVYEDALRVLRAWKSETPERQARIPLKRYLEINKPGAGNPNFANGG